MDRYPNRVEIDCSALRHNLMQIRSLIPAETAVTAVVKADAYGHGMIDAARTLEAAGAERLAVAHLAEALRLRKAGLRCPVVVLCGILTRAEAGAVVENDLIPVLPGPETAGILSDESRRRGKRTRVQLKIDTGMGRLGVPATRAGAFVDEVLKRDGLEPEGLMSHLSSADEADRGFTESQIRAFGIALETARSRGMDTRASSLANSAGTLGYPESHLGMIRPGILLYGGSPSPDLFLPVQLEPAMTLKATVLQLRDFPEGTPISYGRTYTTGGPERIAVISAGYSDGLPRSLSNRGRVLIGGVRAPIRGRICMNLTMADVSDRPEVRPGDEAVFLGRQGDAVLTGDELAGACDTISYEIYCAVGRCGEKTTIP
ncbi:MAG: alanine racemase [Deltaproteobacteria bacterium]|nr:alanine racemase [Deltaproteobacteria bacterium]